MAEQVFDRVAELFNGKTLFLTGVTGLVGKSLIEKLLSLCEIDKLYVLIRSKKGKTPHERLKDVFNNPLFSKLLSQKGDAIKKCIPIEGDVSLPMLGISDEDRRTIIEETHFIVHSAATVRFDDSLKYAVLVNTRGTKFMLELAEECKKLELFIHVSTAYAFPNNKDGITFEKEYPPPANPHEVLNSVNWLSDEVLDGELTKRLLGDIPNTYTFSKALAESLVYEKAKKIPLIICRPAIIIPAFRDPVPGWTNNLQGPAGLFVGAGKGLIRTVYMDTSGYANFAPTDCVASTIMVFSWYHLTRKNSNYIYNVCIPQNDILITWEQIFDTAKSVIYNECPFNLILWYPDGAITTSRLYNQINIIFFQLLPALLIDLILIIAGQKPQFLAFQKRILSGLKMYEFYTVRKWNFETNQLEVIRKTLNPVEKQHYLLEDDEKDVRKYLQHCILYLRRTFFKETDDTLPAARRNMKMMYVLDRLVKLIFFGLVFYYIYKLL